MSVDERILKDWIAAALSSQVTSDLLDELTFAYIDLLGWGTTAPDLAQIVRIFTDGEVTVDLSKFAAAVQASSRRNAPTFAPEFYAATA